MLFKPSDTRPGDVPGKWEPDAVDGIFAGYDMTPGYHWSKRYLVWSLTDFDGLTLRKNVIAEEFHIREPFSVARLRVVPGPWEFPLKARYDHINFAVEADGLRAEVDQPHLLPPPDADPAKQEEAMQDAPNTALEQLPRYHEDMHDSVDSSDDEKLWRSDQRQLP